MQTDLLFDQFDTLLTTPDDVAHLEAAILQLAVRGKLVPQDPADEPAVELLKRIKVEKQQLIHEKKIRRGKRLLPIKDTEIPFELPGSWVWTRLSDLGETQTGTTPPRSNLDFYGDAYPFVRPGNIADDLLVDYPDEGLSELGLEKGRLIQSNSVLMVCIGSVGKVAYVDRECSCNQQINALTPFLGLDSRFMVYFMRSPYFQDKAMASASQTTLPILNKGKWSQISFPLPPLAEQKRIVAKVDELLAQTRDLAAQLEQADAALAPAAQAAFQSLLDAQDTTAQGQARRRAAWQRIADHFDTLTSDPRTIEALKQTVLQLAVQGKLVPQDPNDEPATELLKRIRAEREQLVREGEISNPRDIPPIDPDEVPFALPDGWVWSRLGESTVIVLGQSPPSTTYNSVGEGLPFYQGKKDFGEMYPTPTQWCSEPKKIAQKDDVLISVRAPVGPTNLCEEESCIGRGLAAIRSLAGVSPFYLLYMMRAFEADLSGKGFGTTFTAITGKDLRRFLIPLPPRAEQKRIVAKVDALLALCDALAAEVAAAEEVRARLLRAVLDGG